MAKSFENLDARKEILKLPYLVLIVSLILTIGATYIFYRNAQAKDISRFQSESTGVNNRVEILAGTYISLLKSARGFIESADRVNQEKFAVFVNSLELEQNYKGIQGVGYSKHLLPEECAEFIRKARTEGHPDFKIFPEQERADYQTIAYLEPLNERSRRAIGFDMSTEPVRREAMERARDTGEAALTGKVLLMQETDLNKQAGFLMYVPIYKGGKTPDTIEERRNLLDGYIYCPVRANDFLSDVQKSVAAPDISVTIYENESQSGNILAQINRSDAPVNESLSTAAELTVGGRKWLVECKTLPAFISQSSTGWMPLIFISGFVSSLLLFGMTYLEANARLKAERISSDLQESEREKGFLLEREQAQRKRAEEASHAKDEFISIVSHELRTPLNSIAGWTKILHSENLSSATKKQALQKIDKSLRIQTKIVEDLLDFSQIISGQGDLKNEEVDFSKVFEAASGKIEEIAQNKGVLFIKENSLNGQRICGDGARLQSVVENLLSNAVKFTPIGGKVMVKVKEKASLIEMVIKDTGQGIRGEFLPRIFEQFRQEDSSTTRQHGGLGLGLAISNQIIKLHGGRIKAESEGEGKGAIFTVTLPVHKKQDSPK